MTLLKFVPAWCWWLLAVAAVAAGQQIRVAGLQADLDAKRAAATEQYGKLVACRETRGNLLVQVGEQNSALADLRAKAAARAQQAEQAQASARQQSEADYQAANRLQQERTGGDACAAATTVIDQELGL